MKLRLKRKSKKIISYVLAATMFAGTMQGIGVRRTYAADNAFETSIKDFPESYKVYLRNLHAKYPNWVFKPYKTNIDFATAVENEATSKKSLVENSYNDALKSRATGDYNASTGKFIPHDGNSWVSASKNAVAYFMDPRNFLNNSHITMFEQLSFDASVHTQTGVEAVLNGSFMYNTNMAYITASHVYTKSNTKYSAQFMEAGKNSGVSPYYLASKSLLEVGKGNNAKYPGMGSGNSVNGEHAKYPGIYNFYNIGANDGTNAVANGLLWASGGKTKATSYGRPWNTPVKSINGGAAYIAENYIKRGQDTTYFQRFNVQSKAAKLYDHQYMTNIYGCASEAITTMNAYKAMGIEGTSKTFLIPVYNNMPSEDTAIRIGGTNKTGKIHANVNVRSTPHTVVTGETDNLIGKLSKDDPCTVLEFVQTDIVYDGRRWLNNPYWCKVRVVKNGVTTEGYVSADYVDLNAEQTVMISTDTAIEQSIGNKETAYYEVDDPAILTIDENGVVRGLKEGTTTVRAYTKGGNYSAMAINVMAKGVVLSDTRINLDVSKTKQLTATVYPTNSTDKSVTWKSNNTKVATVSNTGLVKAVGYGSATITCTAAVGGAVGKCVVVVSKPVTSITLNKTNASIGVGETMTLTATIAPKDASNKNVIWKTNNNKVLTLKDGKITGKAIGSATITATSADGQKKATCRVIITPGVVQGIKTKNMSPTKIKISWTPSVGVTGYKIYRADSNGNYKCIAKTTKNSYTNKKLTTGKKYKYKVAAYVVVGGKTVDGVISSPVTKKAAPKKPTVQVELYGQTSAVVSWTKSKKADGYIVYKKSAADAKYKAIKNIAGGSKLKLTSKHLEPGQTYSYKVKAYKYVGKKKVKSPFSNIVSVKR